MTDFARARTLVLALPFLMFLPGSARAMTVSCSGSLNFNSMIPGHSAVHSFSCSISGTTGTITNYSTGVYLTALPQAGSNTLPAGNIAVSGSNGNFTEFTGLGIRGNLDSDFLSPQTIYVQVTAPSDQPSGQYSGTLTVEVDVDYTP